MCLIIMLLYMVGFCFYFFYTKIEFPSNPAKGPFRFFYELILEIITRIVIGASWPWWVFVTIISYITRFKEIRLPGWRKW